MKRPVGRPPTGRLPNLSIRMAPEARRLASDAAKVQGMTLGQWLEEAIREKIEREGNDDD